MGVEIIIIGIIAGASILISGISAATSIGTIFFFKKKYKSTESSESKDTTNVIIENEAIKEENPDGSSKTIRKQKINITDIDMDIGSKLISGSTTITRTGLPNETAETLAKGGVGALNKLTDGVIPQLGSLIEEMPKAEIGLGIIKGGMKLIEEESETTEKSMIKTEDLVINSEQNCDSDDSCSLNDSKKDNGIELIKKQNETIAEHSIEVPKVKPQEVVTVSNILKAVIGGESEQIIDQEAVILAEKVMLGEAITETSGV